MPDNCFAAVDMGTNSFHLIIAKQKEDGSLKIVDREKEVIRLGSHEGKNLSIISADEENLAIEILSRFKKLADFYGANIRAVATSAVREAHNKKDFIENVMRSTGIKVEAVKGFTEARLIYEGVKKALPVKNKKVLCIDIGGGSTEFIYGNNGSPVFAESIKIGAVRLTKMFSPDFVLNEKNIAQCRQTAVDRITSNSNINFSILPDTVVGTSGTIQSAAFMIAKLRKVKLPKSTNGFSFTAEELNKIVNLILQNKTKEDRLMIKGLEEKRADIIPAGIIILQEAFKLFNIKKMVISEYALREGIIYDMIDGHKTGV